VSSARQRQGGGGGNINCSVNGGVPNAHIMAEGAAAWAATRGARGPIPGTVAALGAGGAAAADGPRPPATKNWKLSERPARMDVKHFTGRFLMGKKNCPEKMGKKTLN
jgi:hypothetical protein